MENDKTNYVEETRNFWDARYAKEAYMYGHEPNVFYKSVIDGLPAGSVLIAGAGEGRDGVYAAGKGWDTYCVDMSEAGKIKALALAEQKGVAINYQVADIRTAEYPVAHFDVIVSVFFHLPTQVRSQFYAHMQQWLKPGGVFILQAFTPDQLANSSGGPKDIDMLVTADLLRSELPNMKVIVLEEKIVELDEGPHHSGKANVVELVAMKA